MARPVGPTSLTWDERKKQWRLRFTWKKKRYDFNCATIPRKATAQARYWADARYVEVKSGKWNASVIEGSDPNAELREVARVWLAERSGGVISEGWATTQERHLNVHLVPFFRRLSDVTKGTIASYQAERLKKVRVTTLKKERSTLRQLLEFAESRGWIADVPPFPKLPKKALGTHHKQGRQGPTKALTSDMVERLILALPEFSRASRVDGIRWPLRAYYAIMYETSLRPMFWDRFRVGVNWTPGSCELRITADIDKNRWGRTVPLTTVAVAILSSTKPQEDGRMFAARDYRSTVRRVATKLHLPAEVAERVTAYDMRHQAITRFANSTGGVLGAAYLAGHKQITTTNKYSHANQEHAARAIAALNSGGDSGGARKPTRKKDSK